MTQTAPLLQPTAGAPAQATSEVRPAGAAVGPGDPYYDLLLRLRDAVKADRCTFFVLDREKREVWSRAALGLEGVEIRVGIHRGLVGYVARTGQLVRLRDAYNDPRFNRDVDKATGYRTKAALTVAVRADKKRVVGVLQALNKVDGVFTPEDEQTMERYGEEAAALLASTTA